MIKNNTSPKLYLTLLLITLLVKAGWSEKLLSYSPNYNTKKVLNQHSEPHTPGFQYLVVTQDSTLLNYHTGLANILTQEKLNSSHTLAAFSMTKTLTAIAILKLSESHNLKLNSRLDKYISHPYNLNITIQNLLNHTSGIPDPIPLNWVHLSEDHASYDEKATLKQILIKHSELKNPPGSEYGYSNIGYWLLGRVIEEVSGQSYAEYMRQNIFEPIGLSPEQISFTIIRPSKHAKGYLKKWSMMNLLGRFLIDDKYLGEYEESWLHIKDVYLNGPAFGGAIGTASAFSILLQDLLSNDSKLLSENLLKLLYTRQYTSASEPIDMTLGWHIGTLEGREYYFKEGGGAGFHSEMRIYPHQGIATVIMANRTSLDTRDVLTELDATFLTLNQ